MEPKDIFPFPFQDLHGRDEFNPRWHGEQATQYINKMSRRESDLILAEEAEIVHCWHKLRKQFPLIYLK